jgi:Tfp pilus assembly protein PilO
MSGRDRLMIIAAACIAVVIVAWVMFVSPERKKAKEASAEVASAQSKLSAARGQLGSAKAAQAKYAASYGTIVNLGKAVPTSQEIPSLIYELAQASKQKNVNFVSIASTSSGSSPAASSASSGSSAAAAAAAAAGFKQMPFTFIFNGDYFGLEHMLGRLSKFATRRTSGTLDINGRLLTVQSVKLAPVAVAGHPNELTATVTATAYALPPEEGGGAAAASAAGAGAQPASASGSSSAPSSATAPAVVGAKP